MKTLTVVLAALVTADIALAQATDNLTEWKMLGATPFDARLEMIANLTQARKKELIAEVKNAGMGKDLLRQYRDLLLHLGDEDTMRQQAEVFLHGDARESIDAMQLIKSCYYPRIFTMIAPALFRNEKYNTPGINVWHRSMECMDAMLEMIPKTPGFTGELYEWAPKANSGLPVESLEGMRRWWKQNEKHFLGGNYKAVQAGEIPIPAEQFEWIQATDGQWTPRRKTKAPEAPEPSPATPALVNSAPSATAAPPVVSRVESSAPSTALLVTVAAAAVALLAGLFFFWKRRV